MSAPSPAGAGAVTATLAVPSRLDGREQLVVTARAAAAGIAGSRALSIVPGPPAVARFARHRGVLVADGASAVTLRVVVEDRYGNPVATGAPTLEADRGRVLAVEPAGPGAWRIRYLAPALGARTEAGLVAAVAGARARTDLLLVPPRPRLALLATGGVSADVRGRFVAPRLGLAAERGSSLRLDVPGLSAAWRLETEVLGWTRSRRLAEIDKKRVEVVPSSANRAGVILGGVSAALAPRRGPELWGSATAGLALASARPRGGRFDTGIAPAARLALAAGWPLRLGTPFLEASVLAGGRTPAGAFATLGLAAGIRFDVGR